MSPRLKIAIVGLVPVMAFLIDRGTKMIARGMPVTQGTPLQTGILDTIVHQNHGIVANVPVPIPVIIGFTVCITIVLVAAWVRAMSRGRLIEVTALGLIIGGAVSNLFDRLLYGFVYDWILIFDRGVVNAADIVIVFGAVLYAVEVGRRNNKEARKQRSNPAV
jgi:signal peptidase II